MITSRYIPGEGWESLCWIHTPEGNIAIAQYGETIEEADSALMDVIINEDSLLQLPCFLDWPIDKTETDKLF